MTRGAPDDEAAHGAGIDDPHDAAPAAGPDVDAPGGDTDGDRPPGPGRFLFVRPALRFLRRPFAERERLVAEHGDVVDVSWFGRRAYLVAHPDDVGTVLLDDADRYRKPPLERRFVEGPWPGSVPMANGDRWREGRRALEPAFALDAVSSHDATVVAGVDAAIHRLGDGEVRLHGAMRGLSMAVLLAALFGVDDPGDAVRRDLATVGRKLRVPRTFVPAWVPTPLNLRYRRAVTRLRRWVADRLDERDPGGGDRDAVAVLLAASRERPEAFPRERLIDELMALLFAGLEATATALSYALLLLDDHPATVADVRDEAALLYPDGAAADGPAVEPDPATLPVTDAAIRETLRLYPPNQLLPREATGDTALGGYRVSEGTAVYISQWILHRDDRWWDEPERFEPERFLGDADRPEHAYLPFGAGPRHCLGMRFATRELRLALPRLLQRLEVSATHGVPDPVPSLTLHPRTPCRAAVEER